MMKVHEFYCCHFSFEDTQWSPLLQTVVLSFCLPSPAPSLVNMIHPPTEQQRKSNY